MSPLFNARSSNCHLTVNGLPPAAESLYGVVSRVPGPLPGLPIGEPCPIAGV